MPSINKKKIELVQVGNSSFPVFKAAPTERLKLLSKGLIENGTNVLVVNTTGTLHKGKEIDPTPLEGVSDGVPYKYLSDSVYRPDSFLIRQWKKLTALIDEYRFLGKLKKEHGTKYMIVSTMGFFSMLWYRIMAIRWGLAFIYQIVEWNSSLGSRKGIRDRFEDLFQESIGLGFADGFLPISHHLSDLLAKRYPQKPQLKIPVICDFTNFESVDVITEEPYFLYCGSMSYAEVVELILESYAKLEQTEVKLYLILGGDTSMEGLEELINFSKQLGIYEQIRIFSRIPFKELIAKYCGAMALLIPLRDNLQDRARFPHKIGEYLASGNPVLSTNFGEVRHYFKHGYNAFLAEDYSVESFSKIMRAVLDDPEKAREVGENGRALGLQAFDYKVHGEKLESFIRKFGNEKLGENGLPKESEQKKLSSVNQPAKGF